jgi:hypothetical protein
MTRIVAGLRKLRVKSATTNMTALAQIADAFDLLDTAPALIAAVDATPGHKLRRTFLFGLSLWNVRLNRSLVYSRSPLP